MCRKETIVFRQVGQWILDNLTMFTDCLPKGIKRNADGSFTLSTLENRVRAAYYLPEWFVKKMAIKAAERQAKGVAETKGWGWTMCHHLLKMGALFEKGVQLEEFTLWRVKVLDFTNTTASTMSAPKGVLWKLMTSYEDQAVRCQLHIFELNPWLVKLAKAKLKHLYTTHKNDKEVLALIPYPSTGPLYDPESDAGTLGPVWDSLLVEPTDVDDGRGRVVTLLRRLANGEFTFDLFCQIYAKAIQKPQPDSIDPREACKKKKTEAKKGSTKPAVPMVSAWEFPPLTETTPLDCFPTAVLNALEGVYKTIGSLEHERELAAAVKAKEEAKQAALAKQVAHLANMATAFATVTAHQSQEKQQEVAKELAAAGALETHSEPDSDDEIQAPVDDAGLPRDVVTAWGGCGLQRRRLQKRAATNPPRSSGQELSRRQSSQLRLLWKKPTSAS